MIKMAQNEQAELYLEWENSKLSFIFLRIGIKV